MVGGCSPCPTRADHASLISAVTRDSNNRLSFQIVKYVCNIFLLNILTIVLAGAILASDTYHAYGQLRSNCMPC